MAAVTCAAYVDGAVSCREVGRGLLLEAAAAELASGSRAQAAKRSLAPPPGINLAVAFRPPPGLSLPGSSPRADSGPAPPPGLPLPRSFLHERLVKLGKEEAPEDISESASTADPQESVSVDPSPPLTPSLTPMVAGQLQHGAQPQEVSLVNPSAATVPGAAAADGPSSLSETPSVLRLDAMVPPPPLPPPPGIFCAPGAGKRVLELSDAVSVPEIGSPECPSVGSVGHKLGLCKPCDFIHRNTCRTGAACRYCHLCAPSDVRRLKKERQRHVRAVRQMLQPAALAMQQAAFQPQPPAPQP